jgi:hypothetical protein
MRDFLLVAAVLSASVVIGYPACLLLPAERFRARFMAAPTLGFSVLSAAVIGFYACGVSPRISLVAVSAAGLLASAVHVTCVRTRMPRVPSGELRAFGAATLAVVLLCLLPAWTGGPQFTIFQGNAYDQVNAYLPGSVVFHHYDYATVSGSLKGGPGNPIVANANVGLNRPVSIVHAAFAGMTHSNAPSSSYAFMVALQVNMFFSALFVACSVFAAGHRMSLLVAAALTVGFFEQYVFDINAWSQLAAMPIYLMALAIVVLAFDPDRFGAAPVTVVRLAGLLGLLGASVTLLYPDAAAIYGAAGAAAAGIGMVAGRSRRTTVIAFSGLGLGTTGALALGWWYGTLNFLFGQMMAQALRDLDWWKYFQRYLLGREQDYLSHLTGNADVSWSTWLDSLFSLPVEAIVSGIGLYYLLPTGSWPQPLAIVWKLVLYALVIAVFASAARVMMALWRRDPAGNPSRMTGACIAGCLVPIAILTTGQYWSAGKALSIAAPLLFFIVSLPLLAGVRVDRIGRDACLVVVLGHLMLGVLRPALVSAPSGAVMPGLPTSKSSVQGQKAGMDWEVDRWAAQFRGCTRIIINVDHPFMNKLAQLVATDIGLPWASLRPIDWSYTVVPAYQPPGWEQADCIASDSASNLHAGRKVIWLVRDRAVLDFPQARSGAVEIAAEQHPGVIADGVYAVERTGLGALRWTSGHARFEVANAREAPVARLVLALWPMPLAADARLRLTVNDWTAFDGPVPAEPLTVPLDRFANAESLAIELETAPATRYPNDPRDLGVALRALRLEKSTQ